MVTDLKSFAGIVPSYIDASLNVFETLFEDEEIILQSVKTYEHEEDGFNFKYKYILRIQNYFCSSRMVEVEEEVNVYGADLSLMPIVESIDDSYLEKVASCCSEDPENITNYDVFSYGGFVTMGATQGVDDYQDEFKGFSEADIPAVIALVSNVLETIDGMRGFYLDKVFNKINWNGWDVLNEIVNGEELNFCSKL